ncbi:MAG: MBL fold metallo-hydrolase [Candidatus Omnitrophica bacterium]|nr:MBL fold metallo-hydrolase [Candidatus Omnitrophota bacterium]
MYVKVLYDHKAKPGLLAGHGFACLVDQKVLFDTGGDLNGLVENMDRMMVSAKDIESVVISHDHWDHTEGLWELLRRKNALKVYAGSSFSDTFKTCVKESGGAIVPVDHTMKVAKKIFVTREFTFEYKDKQMAEHALIIKGEKGVSVITGCAHPGIVNMLEAIKKELKIKKFYMVFGGYHLEGKDRDELRKIIADFVRIGVEKVGPTHCAGEKVRRMFKSRYQNNFVPVKGGYVIQL